MRILVVVAHPDDDILGVGGTMLKHSNKGDTIKVIFLATGITSRKKSGHSKSTKHDSSEKEEKVLS